MRNPVVKRKILYIFWTSFAVIIAAVILMTYRSSNMDDRFDHGECYSLDKDWVVSCAGNYHNNVSLPVSKSIGSYPDPVYFYNTLPDKISDSWYIAIPTSLQNVKVFVGDKCLKEYDGGDGLFKTYIPANEWLFIKIDHKCSGEALKIELNSRLDDYHGCIRKIYYGDAVDISYHIAKTNWHMAFSGSFLTISGILLLILNFIACRQGNSDSSDVYMYDYLIAIGVWFLSSSCLSQGIIGDVTLSRAIEFYSLMFLAIPIIRHIQNISHGRFPAAASIISAMSLISICFITVCVYFFKMDFMDLNWITLLILSVTILYGVYSFIIVKREEPEYFKKLRIFLLGTICFGIGAATEILSTFIDPFSESGIYISAGAILYVICIFIWKLSQYKEESTEREKAISQANAKGAFLANMSHEIRTPVSAMIAADQMILDENNEPEVLSYAKDIKESSRELMSLTNKVLDSARMEYGNLKVFDNDYHTSELITSVYKMIENRIEDINIELRYDHELPAGMCGDIKRIEQVIEYLLENAERHTDTGTIVIGIGKSKKSSGECELVICAADTGCGISEDILGSIFGSFRKDENSSRGMGLGLFLAKRITEMMKGTISVRSIKGVGSVFTVRIPQEITDQLPVGEVDHNEAEENVEIGDIPKWIKVLIVDDSMINIKVVMAIFEEAGVKADYATSGQEALKALSESRYDIIFSDNVMPGMDGEELFARLHESDGINRDTPVVMMTAEDDREFHRKVEEKGFAGVIVKPAEYADIASVIIKLCIGGASHEER